MQGSGPPKFVAVGSWQVRGGGGAPQSRDNDPGAFTSVEPMFVVPVEVEYPEAATFQPKASEVFNASKLAKLVP